MTPEALISNNAFSCLPGLTGRVSVPHAGKKGHHGGLREASVGQRRKCSTPWRASRRGRGSRRLCRGEFGDRCSEGVGQWAEARRHKQQGIFRGPECFGLIDDAGKVGGEGAGILGPLGVLALLGTPYCRAVCGFQERCVNGEGVM